MAGSAGVGLGPSGNSRSELDCVIEQALAAVDETPISLLELSIAAVDSIQATALCPTSANEPPN